ncbi:MAG: GAF domain-containing protein, partial [Deltaproteobacteria bacterium]|nr:GAF domain-containing protein [Deltaproteobacteria bacterium]
TIMEAVHKSSDLKEVFNIAIDKVMELTDIDIVGIYLVDENRNEAVLEAHRGLPDKYIERAGRIKYPKGVTWNVINSGETYIVQDVSTDPYVGSVGKESGFQSFMSVPIKIGDRAIGAIHFHSYKKNKFGKREVGLFSSIGTQIAIAVTKAKQRKDLQLVNEDLSLLNTIAATVHKSLSLKEVYNIVLNAVVEITAFDIIMIYLVDENTNEAVLQAHRGLTEDYIKGAGRIPYPKGVTWKAINSGELTLIDDLQKDPDLGPAGRALGHRTMLAVPIKQEEKTIGLVVFASRRVLELTSRDINLLNAIGSQIGTAIVQAYLYEKSQRQAEELRDLYEDLNKRNKDLEILNTVTQAVHQSLELEEIYNVALDMVTSMENVDMAMIYLVDEDRKEAILQAHRNMPEDYIRRAGIIPYPKGTTWRVINTGEIVNIEDAQKDPDIGPAGRDLGHHGILGIPITLQGKVIGVIWFLSYKERQFDKQEMDLLSSLGNQIAIATVKAKLYGELSKKNRYETIISTVTRSVHQSINLQEVLENAVEAMSKNIDGADHVAIYLAEGEEAVLRAYRGHPDWFIERVRRIPYPKGFTWKTIIEGKPRYCPDVDQDTFIGPAGREVGTKSYLSMPIHYEGKTVGVINIHSLQKNAFNEEDRKLLEIVMQQIETAVNNARQAAALREARDELESKVAERTKELVQANIQLKEIDRHKSEFLATMSHELRTPLNSIIGFSEMLLGKTFGDLNEKQKRYINNVLLSGRHLLRLINDILDLSRVEAGQMEPQLEEFSPAEALSEVEAIVKPTADKKGLKLEFSIDNGVKTIWADEGKFKQVMYNLLSNAIKFTESGWVSVKAKLVQGVEDLIEVNIEDTGIGIKAEDMGKLFKEFEQIEGGISRRYEGTGLGLALSKKLVELHGGEIWAESEYGKGSKFTFSLPLRVRSGKEIKEFSDSVDFRVGMVGPKAIELTTEKVYGEGDTLILVVEDDNKAAEILEAYLRDAGYSVARAYNGEDALEKTRDLKPFAITLDILLPNKKDGWDVLKELKESPETRNIPVVIISVVDDKNLGFSLGAVDYLVKPLTRVELLGSLRKLSLKPDFRFETSNVLIIDDNPGMVELISDILRKEGINMIQAYGGREGIDLASQRNPDLIILDLMMPEVNGFDLIAELKKYQKTKYIPLLVFTAKELTEEDKKKLNGHVERVVRKGNFSPRDFIDEIKKFELMKLRKSSVNEGIRGLLDYHVFINYLNNELSRAKRHGGTHSLAVIEFCNFENNNEALSRDKVLINTAQLIINYIYPYDLLAKLEEGRFIWMLPWTNQDLSKRAAERVRSLVEQHSSSVTVSIEIVTYPDDGDTYEKLLDKALRALSEATLRREVCS